MKVETLKRIFWAGIGAMIVGMLLDSVVKDMSDIIYVIGTLASVISGGIAIYNLGKENK